MQHHVYRQGGLSKTYRKALQGGEKLFGKFQKPVCLSGGQILPENV